MIEEPSARHRLYGLLGELLARGPTERTLAIVGQLPALPFPDPESAAAGHHAAVVGSLPWESAWLSADGLLGHTDAVLKAYRDGGFAPAEEPDHVGIQLAYLAHLSAAEAEALADGVDPTPLRALVVRFVDGHLGRWLPALVHAVRDAGEPPWTAVIELAHELVQAHRAVLPGPVPDWELAGTLPDDPELGVDGLARALVTPARSGWLPTAAAFERIATRIGAPSGFGDRAGRMAVLFRAAGAEHLGQLAEALIDELSAADLPAPWVRRRQATSTWIHSWPTS